MKMKAIFGGTFDPIHNGHIHIAYEALYNLNLDKIVFMPSGNPPHKLNKDITDSHLRYEMVKNVVKDEERFEVSDYEINRDKVSYTYETLEFYNKLEKETKWYFLTGVDCLMELYNWKNIKRIMELCTLVVFSRPGFKREEIIEQKNRVENEYDKKIIFLDIPLLDISSTNIRRLIKQDRNISYLVPSTVYNTIKELKLYI